MLTVTATDLPRLLACNGSRLMEGVTPFEDDDTGRKEGDAAHWLIEQGFKHGQPLESLLNKQAPNGIFITAEMIDHVTPYLNDIRAEGGAVEFDTSFQDVKGAWQVRARADHIVHAGGVLKVSNFKYGWRIVEPKMNYTEIWHLIGYLLRARIMGIEYSPADLNAVEVRIYQPRPHHSKGTVRTWRIPRGTLMDIWEKMERILETPNEQLNTGAHCYKCPAMGNCPAFRKAQFSAIEASEQAFTDKLTNADLSAQLMLCERAGEVLKQMKDAYEDLAKHRIRGGQIVPDYLLEKSFGNRKWKPTATPEFMKMMTGKDLVAKQELMTPAAVEKMAGIPKGFVASLTTRDEMGSKLVRIDADEQGNKMFNNQKGS